MTRTQIMVAAAGLVLAAAGWALLRPIAPVDTPYFKWQRGQDGRYQLAVSHVSGNPEFRQGVTTTRAPHSGTLRVSGTAEPRAIVEVGNARTGRGFTAQADDSGAFIVDVDVRRGDTLKVLSRRIEFRRSPQQLYSSAAVSSP